MNSSKPVKQHPRPYHHGDLRRTLIATALKMLRQDQAWDFTLRELARRAGVSHAAPYRHFADKRELLAEVAALGHAALQEKMQEATQRHPDDPKAQLSALGQAYVAFAVENPAHFRLMFGPELATDPRHPVLQKAADATHALMIEAVRRSAAAGLFGIEDSRIQALAAWSLVHGLAMLLIDNRVRPMPADVNRLTAAITKAFVQGADAATR